LWDILRNTVDKTVLRTEVMAKELKAVQDQQPTQAEASGVSTVDDVRLQQARESHQSALRDQNDLLLLVFQV
jgi:hypothetical protein